jgi:hypothetical protein
VVEVILQCGIEGDFKLSVVGQTVMKQYGREQNGSYLPFRGLPYCQAKWELCTILLGCVVSHIVFKKGENYHIVQGRSTHIVIRGRQNPVGDTLVLLPY